MKMASFRLLKPCILSKSWECALMTTTTQSAHFEHKEESQKSKQVQHQHKARRGRIRAFAMWTIGSATFGLIGMLLASAVLDDGHKHHPLQTLYRHGVGRMLRFFIDGETAHVYAVRVLAWPRPLRWMLGLINSDNEMPPDAASYLRSRVWGMTLENPLGIAAGFDKNAECMIGLFDLGFGFVEIGSVTPLPQSGNERPRVFRLDEDRAIINRYGFNSDGLDVVTQRLLKWRQNQMIDKKESSLRSTIGLNLGKNKSQEDATADYVKGVQTAGALADYIVTNISSPNTPGLRNLQGKQELKKLLSAVKAARNAIDKASPPTKSSFRPLLVKIAPDLSEHDKYDIAEVIKELQIDGLIVSNTTTSRPDSLRSAAKIENGGLSGAPLFDMSTRVVAEMYMLTGGNVPIVGVGGVSNADEAYQKIRAGASLVQIYSAMVYEGPAIISDIKLGVVERLKHDGFSNIAQAVGVDASKLAKIEQTHKIHAT